MRIFRKEFLKFSFRSADTDDMEQPRALRDGGFTLIELLIVIVILGVLATVVIVSVRGVVDRGDQATCDNDAKVLEVAVEAYFAREGGSTIPVTSGSVEQTLVNANLVREPSTLHEVATDGSVTGVARCS